MSGFLLDLLLSAVLAATTASSTVVYVQGNVKFTDASPLPGVTVEATDMETWQRRSIDVTDADGYYSLRLSPGIYLITFKLEGLQQATREAFIVEIGPPIPLNVVLTPSTVHEMLTVRAEAPVVPPNTAKPVPSLALRLLESYEAARTGIKWIATAGFGPTVPTALGVNPEVTIEGLPVPVTVASSGAADGPIRVLSGGLPAEYGGGSAGAVLILAERSVGNDLTATADLRLQPGDLRAKETDVAPPFIVREEVTTRELQIAAGGPLLRDHLWIFTSYLTGDRRLENASSDGSAAGRADVANSSLNLRLLAAPNEAMSVSNQLIITQRNAEGILGDFAGHLHAERPVAMSSRDERSLVDVLTGSLGTRSVVLSATLDARQDKERFGPQDGALADIPQERDVLRGFYARGGSGWRVDAEKQRALGISSRANVSIFRHEIGAGVSSRRHWSDVDAALSGGVLIDRYGSATIERFITLDGVPAASREDELSRRDVAIYLQDSKRIGTGVSLNAGARFEHLTAERDGLTLPMDILLPRAAVDWDVRGNGQSRLSASYGAYHEQLSENEIVGLLTRHGSGIRRSPEGPLEVFGPATAVDPDLRPRWSEEFRINYGTQIGHAYYAEVSAERRRLKEDITLGACGDTVCIGNPARGILERISSEGSAPMAMARPRRETDMLNLEAGRRGIPHLIGRYRLARHHGNVEPRLFPETLFTVDPYIDVRGAFGNFRRSAGEDEPLHADRTHQLSVSAGHRLRGIDLAYFGTWQSGAPISRYGVSDRFGTYTYLLAPRGSEGRTPATYELSVSADYGVKLGETNLRVQLSVLNLLNAQRPLLVDERWSFREEDNASPAPANPNFGRPIVRTPPRSIAVAFKIVY